ncbi:MULTISPECIES: glycoside hydrolase family 3 N-terminal domain-containing protein [unclassified Pseudonocardia]|jgi:beta-N-acetylhexosaminidase|uniref:glycoside hydrolase family 3 N-terminal domain-containing protein n=1 Tax=unclassified Pseudonocardia TaxID=2619320 RepID=UPI000965F4B7|nr:MULTISPECIES: glycoside hydrolase family 3 N-terminal domain-containing protein [unclassified Pseudonocardia]MBN9100755.1 glycoside hydrolase family 3 protein [Pseudonocardia sp.]OJY44112.1 MAG: beta-glucosidase [Pseudonocardia sp. 73-21]
MSFNRGTIRPRRSRSAVPLLGGLVVGMLGSLLVAPASAAVPAAAPATAAPTSAPAPAPELTGLALGADRLPDCTAAVTAMTPRARLAQRLMVGVEGDDPAGTASTVRDTQVGGIFVGGNATQLLRNQSLRGVQAASRVPLAVAVDDEGGRVQRIDALDGELPSARTLAATKTPLEVRDVARERAKKLLARGITMNMAPDADVSNQPADDVIGDRSFSNDPDTVTTYALAYALGQREAGIFTVLKHFPGHGHSSGDSHKGRVTTPPLAQLKADDLKPYATLLGDGGALADNNGRGRTAVMVGHLDVPDLTTDLPSSLTPAVYQLLRGQYGFDGLVMTDDLGAMKAITDEFALPEAVQRALEAGADMALWTSGGKVTPVLDALQQALTSGKLDGAANDKAVARILAAKGLCTR